MTLRTLPAFVAGAALTALLVVATGATTVQDRDAGTAGPGAQPSADEIAEMMAAAARYTQPGPNHEVLKRFLGEWTWEMRFAGSPPDAPPMQGTTEATWLIEGRWIALSHAGTVMGMPNETFQLLGHDNFKQSFRYMQVSNMDTAMLTAEGDLTRAGDTLIVYGTLDEYLTGEHDKQVKYVWRFVSDDEIAHEVHDLHIGETDSKVIDVTMRRKRR